MELTWGKSILSAAHVGWIRPSSAVMWKVEEGKKNNGTTLKCGCCVLTDQVAKIKAMQMSLQARDKLTVIR